eukprot:50044_1
MLGPCESRGCSALDCSGIYPASPASIVVHGGCGGRSCYHDDDLLGRAPPAKGRGPAGVAAVAYRGYIASWLSWWLKNRGTNMFSSFSRDDKFRTCRLSNS